MTAISQASYARRLGVTPAAVSQWKKAGSIVMCGVLVDVEKSDAQLARCRRDGLPDIRANTHVLRRASPAAEPVNLMQLRTEAASLAPVPMTREQAAQRLAALDWTRAFDWSEEEQRERARLAAACIGLEAVESGPRDDGHWGGLPATRSCQPQRYWRTHRRRGAPGLWI
ncbi:hypothetical protein PPMP20_38005 [Paraburkholderia phymatum]|uniref:hypothetical protein n=1 Tax=Paraburkholderia phymatum TaxID=148447 RepID=UPI0012FDCA6C|nr:hypothetical protein [Paraburkholderia phymatum]